jgi:hypothetical protein
MVTNFMMTKPRRVRWAGHTHAHTGVMKNEYKISVGKSEGYRP